MKINIKKTYAFAIRSALYTSLIACVLVLVLALLFFDVSLQQLFYFGLAFLVSVYAFSFWILQYRVEQFIYKRVKKLYDEVSLLESSSFFNQPITTDIETLSKGVKKFAMDKKMEIELLQARERYRREFLGNVSHELKTPLFTVQGYISTLLDGAMSDKSIRKKYLGRAEKGVERLIHIVEDLDMIAKLESGDLHLEISEFDIVELAQNVFDLLEMRADAKGIILMFDKVYTRKIMVKADAEKIQQILMNLVVNSIKYGKENGTTEVAIEDFVNNKVIVRVKDNGIGIEKSNINRLFERFFRVDKSGARSEGGSGLGLSIVKHIVEAHHEKIYVESEFGKGSEFSFTLEKA